MIDSPPAPASVGLETRRFEVRVERGVPFGRGRVGFSQPGSSSWRDLLLDVYDPFDAGTALRPGLVMAFGGAFHRGSRENDRVAEGAQGNTSVADYCRMFASRGMVCFSIDYRLVPEDPYPGDTPVVIDSELVPRSRVDVVRELLGLPKATTAMLWRGIEAASDDFATAFRYVEAHAPRWRLDPSRVAVGGFSAGARSAWNAAYGESIDAAAIVSLSGTMHPGDLRRFLSSERTLPPLLLIRGENDLDYVCDQNPQVLALCRSAGIDCVEALIPGAGHFYPASARARIEGATAASVEDVIAEFLSSRCGPLQESAAPPPGFHASTSNESLQP